MSKIKTPEDALSVMIKKSITPGQVIDEINNQLIPKNYYHLQGDIGYFDIELPFHLSEEMIFKLKDELQKHWDILRCNNSTHGTFRLMLQVPE